MQFKARNFDHTLDREVFTTWLRKRGDDSDVDFSFFPPTGLMVLYDGEPVCAGFMIKCDNKTCMNTDLVGDPDAPKEVRNEAVIYLRDELAKIAKKDGYPFVLAITNNSKLVERLKEQGYIVLDSNLTHLGRSLWHY